MKKWDRVQGSLDEIEATKKLEAEDARLRRMREAHAMERKINPDSYETLGVVSDAMKGFNAALTRAILLSAA